MSVLEILATKNIIKKNDILSIENEITSSGSSMEEVLMKRGVAALDILKSQGEFWDLPIRDLEDIVVPEEVLEYIPEEAVMHYRFVPLAVTDGVLEVGITDPDNIESRDALNFISSKVNLPFKIFLISLKDFKKVATLYKGLSEEVTKALSELNTGSTGGVSFTSDHEEGDVAEEDLLTRDARKNLETRIIEDAPITKIVATILRYATDGNASDIHIEHTRENVRVRFRVDGVLNTSLILPAKVHSAVVARIKILSNMRLDEKRKPQDGRFSVVIEGRKIDFRVSTFPTYFGEKIVMRLLDQGKGVKKLSEMGLTEKNLNLIKKAIKRSYGLILVSGPTGSGKSTTLYSMLNELDRDTQNVLSLEDPIEYSIDGVSQSQIKPEIDYTFANGLRTTLRQDPDIIMVGEIRDSETAKLAIQAALTGHLVLATIHTNNAAGVIPRLIDMKVDPYLIAPTLIIAIAQRLVNLLCPDAGEAVPMSDSLQQMVDKQFEDLPEEFRAEIPTGKELYRLSPSPSCPSGTRGRAAVMEILEMDKDIEEVILRDPTESSIMKAARSKGMLTMKEDALLKAFKREIPIEEVNEL